MTTEEIVRDEANQFVYDNLEGGSFGNDDHKEFIQNLRNELFNFYEPELKMIFLDQVKLNVETKQVKHKISCTRGGDCEKDKNFDKIIFYINQEVNELPKILKKISEVNSNRDKVFISYSHKDIEYLNDLKRHFKPLEKSIEFWDDSMIKTGQKWKEEIKKSIDGCKVALLLVSADFFNSDFILNDELPPLLKSAEESGSTIITIILKPCLFEEYPQLNQFQAINNPSKPVSTLSDNDKEFLWVETTRQIKLLLK